MAIIPYQIVLQKITEFKKNEKDVLKNEENTIK